VRVRSMKDGAWAWFGKNAAELALSHGGSIGFAIYAGLCKLESDSPEKGAFFASACQIARVSGISARSVERHLRILAQAGVIAIESGRHKGPGGAHAANRITMLSTSTPAVSVTEASVRNVRRSGGQIKNPYGVLNRKNPRSAPGGSKAAPAGEGEDDYSWEPLSL
jgi:hypothetical protein